MTQAGKYGRREFIGRGLLFLQAVIVAEAIGCRRNSVVETQTIEKTIELYIEAWNKEGVENIKATLKKCWIANGSYTDPRYEPRSGLDNLAQVLQDSQDKFPGRTIEVGSKIDCHHGSGRYIWRFSQPGGPTSEGLDYFDYDAENRITRLVSFFGKI